MTDLSASFSLNPSPAGPVSIYHYACLCGGPRIDLIVNLLAKRPFFHENFTDFDRVFGVSDESGTYNERESYVLDPKLTLTCIALLRKVPILYRIGKKYSASSTSGEKNT